jgi:hypothetical protein
MAFLRSLGPILLVILVAWVAWSLMNYQHWRPPPDILGVGNGFVGSDQLSAEEIRTTVDAARARVIEINQTGRWLLFGGDICVWLSFACTAAITLIAGWFGRAPAAGVSPDTARLSPGPTRIIGVLAALAAVLTGAGTMATDRGHNQYDRARQAQTEVNVAVKAINDSTSADEARSALDSLKLKVGQL